MRSQNIKLKGYAGASSLLLLLAFLMINPVVGSAVYAEGDEYVEEIEDIESEEVNYDDEIMLTAATPSTVGISFSPASGSASLSPTTSAGQSAQIKVLATVNVQKSGGYSVYIKSNSQNLIGQKSNSNTIPGIQGTAAYANIPVNTWGYYATEGNTIPDKAVSTTGNGDKIAENTSNKITSDTKTIALSFAAKVNDTKPADTYQNTVTMSVVSSPLQTTLTDISDMQSMTSEICSASAMYETKQLKDTRDGKYYWVTKLADNKCWMTQNLDLDLSTGTALTSATSDVSSNWTPGFNTATQATASTVNSGSQTETRSWSLGDYRITNPTTSSDCGSKKASAANCSSQFTVYTTPTSANGDANAHYILGNHYQWNAATAGTGGTITSGQASASICPKGWKLPESNTTAVGSFGGLINAGSIGTDVAKLTSSPYYFVRGGIVYQDSDLFYRAGNFGAYWSSIPSSNNTYGLSACGLNYNTASSIDPSYGAFRNNGYSVRCIAR